MTMCGFSNNIKNSDVAPLLIGACPLNKDSHKNAKYC